MGVRFFLLVVFNLQIASSYATLVTQNYGHLCKKSKTIFELSAIVWFEVGELDKTEKSCHNYSSQLDNCHPLLAGLETIFVIILSLHSRNDRTMKESKCSFSPLSQSGFVVVLQIL